MECWQEREITGAEHKRLRIDRQGRSNPEYLFDIEPGIAVLNSTRKVRWILSSPHAEQALHVFELITRPFLI